MLHLCLLSRTLTIRITDEIADWLEQTSRRTGIPAADRDDRPFMRLAGQFDGPGNLSRRKGFSRK